MLISSEFFLPVHRSGSVFLSVSLLNDWSGQMSREKQKMKEETPGVVAVDALQPSPSPSSSSDRDNANDHHTFQPTEHFTQKKPLGQRIKGIVWDTLDRNPEERRFLAKLDFFILTWASLTYFSKNLNTNNVCMCCLLFHLPSVDFTIAILVSRRRRNLIT